MTSTHHPKVVVVGGGIGGLTAAYRMIDRAKITLLEGAERIGGVIRTIRKDGFTIETGPDCFISDKPAALELARDLRLEDELIGTQSGFRRSYILKRNKLIPVPQGFYLMAPKSLSAILFSSIMSWSGKIRMAKDLWIPPKEDDEDESLSSFVTRRLGREALERVAQPMIAGIYTADPNTLSLKATMPRFLELERKYGSVIRGLRRGRSAVQASGPRYGLFVSFKSGMQSFIEALSERLTKGEVRLNSVVDHIERIASGKWRVWTNGEALEADHLFLALPSHHSASLLNSINPELASTLLKIPYASSRIVNLIYRADQIEHPMNGMGFVIPAIEKRSLQAASFSFRKFEGRAPEGFALIRTFSDGEGTHLTENIHKDLAEILGITGDPVELFATRWDKSMAQYTLGHLERVEAIEKAMARLPGLHLVGNAYRGIGIPDVIASATRAVNNAFSSP